MTSSELFLVICCTAVLSCLLVSGSIDNCPPGFFGTTCTFQCHCESNRCNSTGHCIDSTACSPGWFGPGCQYVNVAFTSKYSSVPKLTTGQLNDCLADKSRITLNLVLFRRVVFTWLRMTVATSGRDLHFNFELTFNSPQNLHCWDQSVYNFSDTVDVRCRLSSLVDQLTLLGSLVSHLCTIYVSGGRNVALKQRTHQSDTHQEQGVSYDSSLAVDGNIDGSCSRTGPPGAHSSKTQTWSVYFSAMQPVIVRVLIHLSLNSSKTPDGLVLILYGVENDIMSIQLDSTPIGNILDKTINATRRIRHIEIQSWNQSLILCEVEAFGESSCPESHWGPLCQESCSCQQECHHVTGQCGMACLTLQDGFCHVIDKCTPSRSSCKDNICLLITDECEECSTGLHGSNCTRPCPPNCSPPSCGRHTGLCCGCLAGFFGSSCSQRCPSSCKGQVCEAGNGTCPACSDVNMYGQLCQNTCNPGCSSLPCDRLNGSCSCKSGYYGVACSRSCSTDCLDDCDVVSGECLKTKTVSLIYLMIPIVVILGTGICLLGTMFLAVPMRWSSTTRQAAHMVE